MRIRFGVGESVPVPSSHQLSQVDLWQQLRNLGEVEGVYKSRPSRFAAVNESRLVMVPSSWHMPLNHSGCQELSMCFELQ